MSSLRQIEANRRNARLSTGTATNEGKRKSRQNALRHGLTAETVIGTIEDVDDYTAFEMAITAEYDAQSAVERELVLRLASLLWRLRRATTIETGLFEHQARHLTKFRQRRNRCKHRQVTDVVFRTALGSEGDKCQNEDVAADIDDDTSETVVTLPMADGITRAYLRLTDLPACPLDRLSRYEAALWRQTCQVLFTLQCLNRRRPWRRPSLGR